MESEINNGYLTRNLIAGTMVPGTQITINYLLIPSIIIILTEITGVTIFEFVMSIFCVEIVLSTIQGFCYTFLADFLLNIIWECSILLIIKLNIGIGVNGISIGNNCI